MRFTFCFLLCLSPSVVFAQQTVAAFARQQSTRDSVQLHKAQTLSQTKNIPAQIIDSLDHKTWLLVSEEDGGYAYRASLNQQAAITTGAAQLQDEIGGYQLNGTGITCGIWEDGLVKDHIEFGNRILSKEGTVEQTHATHVAGTILAAGINPSAKGMAPKATAYTYFFDNDFSEMAALASEDEGGLLFSNHSYGTVTGWSKPNGVWTWYGDPAISNEEDYRHGFYNARAQRVDELAYLAPYYTIVWAAGNDRFETGDGTHPADCNKGTGYDCIIPDATSKNIITVGAVQKVLNYTSASSVPMSWFSSWGPTDDGRIKPDVVAAGVDVFSLSADGANTYTNSTGTSMATPNVTGSLMLLQELNAKLNAGNYLKASTIKALAIHTAKEAGPKPGPDYQFGWGLLDVKAAADVLLRNDNAETRIVEERLHNKDVYQFSIKPRLNTKITLTLSWTDPAGIAPAASLDPLTKMLVNDLDVRLIDEDGIVTLPWVLNPSVPQAQATTGDNTRDNVEKIELETPLNKTYTVLVRHKNELQHAAQDFSLIVTYTGNTNTSQTFFWTGGTGQWQDPVHWSFASAGTTANQIPDAEDLVIVDENSLSTGDTISLAANAEVKKIVWLNSQNTFLNLNKQALTISGQLTMSSANTSVLNGAMLFASSTETGTANFFDNELPNTHLHFTGPWKVNGSVKATRVLLNTGVHQWQQADVEADVLKINTDTWNISGANVIIHDTLAFATKLNNFISDNARFTFTGSGFADWKENACNGHALIDDNSDCIFSGRASLRTLMLRGQLEMKDDFTVDTLQMAAGATWQLANGKTQTITSEWQLSDAVLTPTTIQGNGKSTLALPFHKKLCFDNLAVRNVDVTGKAVVNAGENSAVENSMNWQQLPCEQVLFADFVVAFPCVNGLTAFTDLSAGNPASWQWRFTGLSAPFANSAEQHPAFTFQQAGEYTITLAVESGTQLHTVSKSISVQENTFPENDLIITSDGKLMSLLTAAHYQWYNNLLPLAGETQRQVSIDGEPGVYQVVVQEGNCNRLSDVYVITAAEDMLSEDVAVFPNPARGTVVVSASPVRFSAPVTIYNSLHGKLLTGVINESINVETLSPGIYYVMLKTIYGTQAVRKLVIAR
jgi:subtilisin family serine protease/PKD repeat protein